jgi:hypothetical protein
MRPAPPPHQYTPADLNVVLSLPGVRSADELRHGIPASLRDWMTQPSVEIGAAR